MQLIKGYDSEGSTQSKNLWVPVSYSSFKYFKPLTQQIYSWVRNSSANSVDDDFASFDICLYDESGNILVEVSKLTIKKISGIVDFSVPDAHLILEKDSSSDSPGDVEFKQLSPAEMAFQHNLSQGILPREGVKSLFYVLQQAIDSQVIISSLPIDSLIEEIDASAAAMHQQSDDTKFARPELDNDYVEPKDDIELTLVGFWEELLGVDQVGTQDSFFDLGGHSLVAVRLFAKIQQTYDVDYPISILFEAPTISACADLLREVVGEVEAISEDESSEKSHKARYTHLVPMHSSKSSKLTPFFLVAGMFGNVLNLRHLAQLIGEERPFYGLQARGLYGDHAPHETFEEMASDYIAEIKTVQANGPYILGGFSGGGITAYEMAKQLKAAGDEVAQVIFLDTPLPYNDPLSSVDRMSIHWQRVRTKGVAYFAEWAKNRYEWELKKFRSLFSEVEESGETPAEFKSGDMEAAFYQALSRYNIEALDISAKLFRPKLPVQYSLSGGRLANINRQVIHEDNGWPRYVNDFKVAEVPGNHDSMVLEPNVRVLATKMRQCIDEADPKMEIGRCQAPSFLEI
jgi:thioesterase domain-containing protein/acyl carrier protein